MLATTGVFAVLVGGRGACRAVEDHRHRGSLPPAKTRQDFFPPVHHRIDSEARPPSRGRDELKRRACKPHRDVMAWLMGRLDRRCGLAGTPRTCAAEHGELVGCRRRGHHRAQASANTSSDQASSDFATLSHAAAASKRRDSEVVSLPERSSRTQENAARLNAQNLIQNVYGTEE